MLESRDVGRWFPGVGTAMLVLDLNNHSVLLGKRKGGIGAGMWSAPGGRVEHNEDALECAIRETQEEAGILVQELVYDMIVRGPYTEDRNRPDGMHWITLFFLARSWTGNVRVCEPDKCEEWKWFKWNELPVPMFYPMQNLVAMGYDPFGEFTHKFRRA